jgi:hypothetical protein
MLKLPLQIGPDRLGGCPMSHPVLSKFNAASDAHV